MRACRPKTHEEERERKRESMHVGERVREQESEREREREREREGGREIPGLWLLFYMLFFPLGLPSVNWASQESYFFYLRSSLWSSDLPLFYFCGLFPSLSFSHHHSGLIFPILTA